MESFIIPQQDLENIKFIQLYFTNSSIDTPILRYATGSSEIRHADILARVVREFSTQLSFINQGGITIPAPRTLDYRLVGAGKCSFKDQIFRIWGASLDYCTSPNPDHLSKIATLYPKIKFELDKARVI